jgi:hypothetical protein
VAADAAVAGAGASAANTVKETDRGADRTSARATFRCLKPNMLEIL